MRRDRLRRGKSFEISPASNLLRMLLVASDPRPAKTSSIVGVTGHDPPFGLRVIKWGTPERVSSACFSGSSGSAIGDWGDERRQRPGRPRSGQTPQTAATPDRVAVPVRRRRSSARLQAAAWMSTRCERSHAPAPTRAAYPQSHTDGRTAAPPLSAPPLQTTPPSPDCGGDSHIAPSAQPASATPTVLPLHVGPAASRRWDTPRPRARPSGCTASTFSDAFVSVAGASPHRVRALHRRSDPVLQCANASGFAIFASGSCGDRHVLFDAVLSFRGRANSAPPPPTAAEMPCDSSVSRRSLHGASNVVAMPIVFPAGPLPPPGPGVNTASWVSSAIRHATASERLYRGDSANAARRTR